MFTANCGATTIFRPNYIDGPVSIQVRIQASREWFTDVGSDQAGIVQDIVNRNSGTIHSFLNGQIALARGKAFWAHEYAGDVWCADFSSNSGQARCLLTIRPENSKTAGSSTNTGGIYTIDAKFTDWSLTEHGTIIGSWNLWGGYTWSGGFSSGTAGTGVLSTALDGMVYWEVEVVTLPTGVPPAVVMPQTDGGETSKDDVFINEATSVQYLFPDDLDTFLNPVLGLVPDTFLPAKPTKDAVLTDLIIGLDDNSNPGARSIGVSPSKNRRTDYSTDTWVNGRYVMKNAIYSTDFRDADGATTFKYSWANAGHSVSEPSPDGISTVVTGLTTYQCLDPSTRTDKDKMAQLNVSLGFEGTFISGIQGAACLFGANTRDAYILADEDAFPLGSLQAQIDAQPDLLGAVPWEEGFAGYPPGTGPLDGGGGGAIWPVRAVTNGPLDGPRTTWAYQWGYGGTELKDGTRVYAAWGTIHFIPGTRTTTNITNYTVIGDVFFGDDFSTSDYELCGAIGGPNYVDPTGANKLGAHAWAIKGRGDYLMSTKDPSAGAADPISSPLTKKGVWTGVDFGSIKVKDIFMFAVDTKTRKVWIGKNKQWYGMSGATNKLPGQKGFDPVTYMDGDTNTKYYPAATYRLGHTVLKMRFGTSTKYQPPAGFTPYNLVTIDLP